MCAMIKHGVFGLSAIIAVCGTNFCTFVADRRKVDFTNGEIGIISDEYNKIYKINDHLVYGATGLFGRFEHPQDVFTSAKDINTLSVKMAKNMIVAYMKRHADEITKRQCLVGGRVHDGSYAVYEIVWDNIKRKPVVTERHPDPPKYNFSISLSLPYFAKARENDIMDGVEQAVTASMKTSDLSIRLSDIIKKIEQIDPTVGGNPQIISIQR